MLFIIYTLYIKTICLLFELIQLLNGHLIEEKAVSVH